MILLVFDCDGTLADSQHAITAAMAAAFAEAGLHPPPREAVRRVVGLSLETAVGRLVPDIPDHEVRALARAYKSAFQEIRQSPGHREPLYPGVRAALDHLAREPRVLLGVATGKSVRGVKALFEREGIDRHFFTIQTADTHPSKPHPAMLEAAMREAGAEPGRTLMIGDTTFDVEMAGSAGTRALGVGWGYHAPEELRAAGADALVAESEDLLDAIVREIGVLEAKS